ncbi:E3 ubiquitin-protein ligase TRIM11-like [Gracilinanus agilis]|uniref:E3 ubiquitin-protein ligase TRIM11-like n=1 Tax=Gracilinanus agilis TaxID=191870 RepID=UPI001CFF16CD|nr:E3 ubiquitin-protein ligase TRIM11-like [Gracilinanus agilis]
MASCPEQIELSPKELICSVCECYFTNLISWKCGHRFCHSCLFKTEQKASTSFTCPECRRLSQSRDFTANDHLGKFPASKRRLYPSLNLEEYGKCKIHEKDHKLFCEDDQSPVCVSCSQSQEHEGHRLFCIDEAAENVREEMELQKKFAFREYWKLSELMNEEKDSCVSFVQRKGRANLEGLNKTLKALSCQNKELRETVTKLQEEWKKPDVELLQDMKRILNRNEFVLQKKVETFQAQMIVCIVPGVMEKMFHFKVDITLDCNTADSGLIISEDLKSVRYGGVQDELPNDTQKIQIFIRRMN